MTPAPDREDPPPRPADYVAQPMSDVLHHGYQGLAAVAEALRGSAMLSRRVMTRGPAARDARRETPARPPQRHMRPGLAGQPGPARPMRDPQRPPEDEAKAAAATQQSATTQARTTGSTGGEAPPEPTRAAGLIGEVAHLMADAIDLAGEVAYEVAGAVTGLPSPQGRSDDGEQHEPAEIAFAGAPGDTVTTEFTIWNTGSAILKDVTFTATSLRGPDGEIDDEQVRFEPAVVAAIPSGRPQTVQVHVAIPERQPAGRYRGIAQAEPGGAYTVLELTVAAPA